MKGGRKSVIVTGGNGDLGRAIVTRLNDAGFAVAACIRKDDAALREAIKDRNGISLHHLDLGNDDKIKSCAKEIFDQHDHIFGLINSAAVASGALFGMTRINEMRELFQVNLFGTLQLTQFVAKKMMRNKSGVIVNMASTAGLLSDPGTLAYGGSKAALIHATRVLAAELGPVGIRVNAIAPSAVVSSMANQMDEAARAQLDDRSALKGITTPADIAAMVAFLLSDDAAKISAQVLRVDRGMSI